MFENIVDKRLFVYYDKTARTNVRNKCSVLTNIHLDENYGEANRMKRNHSKKYGDVQQRQVTISFCSIIAVVIMCSVFFSSIITQAAPRKNTYKYYTSIQIKTGDTLWEIAGRYMTNEYDDRNEYMREVCSINHISEDEIHAGQFLVVPYYSVENDN